MFRVAVQPDLFVSGEKSAAPPPDPLAELRALLDRLRAASSSPWPDAAAAMAEEHRVLGLARQAGGPGAALAAAILDETERLLSASDAVPSAQPRAR
ncbi:MAG: hypothetical protein ACREFZ_02400 [Acetobacteraceae bacterium]